MHLQRIGVWAHELRLGEESVRREAATLLEELGYGTLVVPGRRAATTRWTARASCWMRRSA